MPIPFCVVYGYFPSTVAELSSCHCMAQQNFTLCPFTEKACWFLLRGVGEPLAGRNLGPCMAVWGSVSPPPITFAGL